MPDLVSGDWSARSGYEIGHRLAAMDRGDRRPVRQRPDGAGPAARPGRARPERPGRRQRGRLRRHPRGGVLPAAADDCPAGLRRARPPRDAHADGSHLRRRPIRPVMPIIPTWSSVSYPAGRPLPPAIANSRASARSQQSEASSSRAACALAVHDIATRARPQLRLGAGDAAGGGFTTSLTVRALLRLSAGGFQARRYSATTMSFSSCTEVSPLACPG